MEKVKKTYRITQETADKLAELAQEQGCTATEALERAIRDSHTDGSNSHTEPYAERTLELLTEQLAIKDEQIRSLSHALEAAQDTARAAQALHGAEVLPKAIEEPQKPKRGLLERIFGV